MDQILASAATFSNAGVHGMHLLVVSEYARALTFYRKVLGATLIEEKGHTLAFLAFGGGQILRTVGGGPTSGKPTVTFHPPTNPDMVNSEITMRVPNCHAAYGRLRARGAVF